MKNILKKFVKMLEEELLNESHEKFKESFCRIKFPENENILTKKKLDLLISESKKNAFFSTQVLNNKKLNLSRKKFTGLDLNCFKGHYDVEEIDLSDNNIMHIDCKVFEKFKSLKKLNLDEQTQVYEINDRCESTRDFTGEQGVHFKILRRHYQIDFDNIEILIRKNVDVDALFICGYDEEGDYTEKIRKQLTLLYKDEDDEVKEEVIIERLKELDLLPQKNRIYNCVNDTFCCVLYSSQFSRFIFKNNMQKLIKEKKYLKQRSNCFLL